MAGELFAPTGEPPPARPWFGESVDRFIETARDRVLGAAGRAKTFALEDPTVRSAIERADDAIRQLTAKLSQEVAQPLALSMEALPFGRSTEPVAETTPKLRPELAKQVILEAGRVPVAAASPPPSIPFHVGPGRVDDSDPFEPLNRAMFQVNSVVRSVIFDPIATAYRQWASPPVQTGVRNFFANLREPVSVLSYLLEGDLGDATNSAARFGVNTTIGIVGVFDPATSMGLPSKPRNLEQTLCAYGLPSGPYLVLPIFGPATLRDSIGRIAVNIGYFQAMGSVVYVPYRLTDISILYADQRDMIRFAESISPDPYIAQRVLYLSTRTMSCTVQGQADKDLFAK